MKAFFVSYVLLYVCTYNSSVIANVYVDKIYCAKIADDILVAAVYAEKAVKSISSETKNKKCLTHAETTLIKKYKKDLNNAKYKIKKADAKGIKHHCEHHCNDRFDCKHHCENDLQNYYQSSLRMQVPHGYCEYYYCEYHHCVHGFKKLLTYPKIPKLCSTTSTPDYLCSLKVVSSAESIYHKLQEEGHIRQVTFSEKNSDEVISYTIKLTELVASSLANTKSCYNNTLLLSLATKHKIINKSRKLQSVCNADATVDLTAVAIGGLFGFTSSLLNSGVCKIFAEKVVTQLDEGYIYIGIEQPELIPALVTFGPVVQTGIVVIGSFIQSSCGNFLENSENSAIKALNKIEGRSDETQESFDCGVKYGDTAGSLVDITKSFVDIQNVVKELGGGKTLINEILQTSKDPTVWSDLINKVLKSVSEAVLGTFDTAKQFCDQEGVGCNLCSCKPPPPPPKRKPPPPPPKRKPPPPPPPKRKPPPPPPKRKPPPPPPKRKPPPTKKPVTGGGGTGSGSDGDPFITYDITQSDCYQVSQLGKTQGCCNFADPVWGVVCDGDLPLPLCPGEIFQDEFDNTGAFGDSMTVQTGGVCYAPGECVYETWLYKYWCCPCPKGFEPWILEAYKACNSIPGTCVGCSNPNKVIVFDSSNYPSCKSPQP